MVTVVDDWRIVITGPDERRLDEDQHVHDDSAHHEHRHDRRNGVRERDHYEEKDSSRHPCNREWSIDRFVPVS